MTQNVRSLALTTATFNTLNAGILDLLHEDLLFALTHAKITAKSETYNFSELKSRSLSEESKGLKLLIHEFD